MPAVLVVFEERGGEGGRPIDGVNWEEEGSLRFSRGFLNIRATNHITKDAGDIEKSSCGVFWW